ncbi:hypothetical protein EI427_03890 [Flammeovirga pectinis]|uniref:Uncharacterized protein n=1 Tax=Flammeovirga pectinis TaxID=2494373 RepID=A0A3Q9FJB7_9BACT|nr:hypothetical protein [Flammeovirga pectinis]AZQ61393.1 hypothetical protein EI427_03890 [Flammeovirga pectinis]
MNNFNSQLLDTIPLEIDFRWSLQLKRGVVEVATFAFKALSNNVNLSRERTERIHRELLTNYRFREDFGIEDVNQNELVVYKSQVGTNSRELDRKMKMFKRWVIQAQRDAQNKIEKFSPTI